MSKYLIIESRDPFESVDAGHFSDLIEGLTKRGNEVVLFLIQNGVFPAREGSQYNDRLKRLAGQKVRILADGFSLRERAIHHVVSGIEKIEMKDFVRLLFEPGVKAVWH